MVGKDRICVPFLEIVLKEFSVGQNFTVAIKKAETVFVPSLPHNQLFTNSHFTNTRFTVLPVLTM